MCFGFLSGEFFPCGGNSFNLQGLISTTRGKFEPHLFAIWRHRWVKIGSNKIVLPNYVKRAIKPLGKICKMQKNWLKTTNLLLLGDTAYWNWICCAALFPHWPLEFVEGHLKMPHINGAKAQCLAESVNSCELIIVSKLRTNIPTSSQDLPKKIFDNGFNIRR